jgi:hypothetical protein
MQEKTNVKTEDCLRNLKISNVIDDLARGGRMNEMDFRII